ncbi:MAG: hypothetical protein D6798_00720 [Deltaproteobacteria bacterium]|nr:MAG: hypothetical protein D6798_00720 [Deltaproteobacteria bacterium]
MTDPRPGTDTPQTRGPGRVETALLRLGTVGELMALFLRGGRWWMMPLVVVLVLVSAVLLFLQSIHYIAPFVYAVI